MDPYRTSLANACRLARVPDPTTLVRRNMQDAPLLKLISWKLKSTPTPPRRSLAVDADRSLRLRLQLPAWWHRDPDLRRGQDNMNTYKGGVWQQALSALTFLPSASYQGTQGQFSTYGFEYWPSRGSDGYITWTVDGERSWTMTTAALAANPRVEIGPRLIPEEPMVR
jgi:hypothetical protein